MQTTHSEWYQALDPAKKQAIRDLHRVNPYWNLVGLLFVAAWIVTGAAVVMAPTWYWRLPGYVLIGLLIHGMSNFMHEGIHGTLFKNRRWDRWFGFVMGAPSLFSMTAYGVNHLLHHKHTRTDKDPDSFYNFSKDPATLSFLYYAWLAFGMVFYSVRVPWVAVKHGSRDDYSHMAVERTLLSVTLLALAGSAWWFGFFGVLVQVWIIPLGVAALLGNVRGWAEHTQTVSGHPLTENAHGDQQSPVLVLEHQLELSHRASSVSRRALVQPAEGTRPAARTTTKPRAHRSTARTRTFCSMRFAPASTDWRRAGRWPLAPMSSRRSWRPPFPPRTSLGP